MRQPDHPTTVPDLNAADEARAAAALLSACGAQRWVARMLAARPFADLDAVLDAAEQAWWALDADDWLEAFRAHPRIGERAAEARTTERSASWSSQEQRGATQASDVTRQALAEINRAYEARFGFIYIVCATGKSAEQMLALARERLDNPPGEELRVAAAEQLAITHLRLRKLLAPEAQTST